MCNCTSHAYGLIFPPLPVKTGTDPFTINQHWQRKNAAKKKGELAAGLLPMAATGS
jgi:hypothetical protein